MKFILKGPFKENIYNLIRIIGYHFQDEDKGKKELVFTRPAKGYPRFHIYSIWGKMVSTLFFFKFKLIFDIETIGESFDELDKTTQLEFML